MTDQPNAADPTAPPSKPTGPAAEPTTEPTEEPTTEPTEPTEPTEEPTTEPAAQPTGLVVVTRSGGFAGMTLRGQVNLDRLDDPDRSIWQSALSEGLTQLTAHEPTPDRFVYRVRSAQAGLDITVGDHELPDHLRSLLDSAVRPPT
jgi:hypothetical protein